VIAAADWSTHPSKRWICVARLEGGLYHVTHPAPAGDPHRLLPDLGEHGPALVGFDFPIGLPAAYCRRAGIASFLAALPHFPDEFYTVSNAPSLRSPFYPASSGAKGSTRQATLYCALGIPPSEWLRRCDAFAGASPIFWTLGPRQAGRAAIAGWRDVLRHRPPGWSLLPFEPRPAPHAIVEVYPALAARMLGLPTRFGKRSQAARLAQAPRIEAWLAARPVLRLEPDLLESLRGGFGPTAGAEDPLDAFLALLAMCEVLANPSQFPLPSDPGILNLEGWIFGLTAGALAAAPVR
jgi:hypothetical protein